MSSSSGSSGSGAPPAPPTDTSKDDESHRKIAAALAASSSDTSSGSDSDSSSSSSDGSASSASLPGQRIAKKKGKGRAAARKRKATVPDSDSDAEEAIPRRKRPVRSTAGKRTDGGGKKKKSRARHEEAEEDLRDEEAIEAGASGKGSRRIRKRDEVSDDDKQRYVKLLIDDMLRAAEDDHAAFRSGKPALNKEAMLERVRQDLLKSDLHEILLNGYNNDSEGKVGYGPSVLDALAAWLKPVDRRYLPVLRLRTTLFQLISQLPAELDHLKGSSGIGALLMEFRERPDETMENKRLLDSVIRRWMRMIMGKADSYVRVQRDQSGGVGGGDGEEGGEQEPRRAHAHRSPGATGGGAKLAPSASVTKSLAQLIAEEDSDPEPSTPGKQGSLLKPTFVGVHARVPEPVTFNYVKSPQVQAVEAKAKPKLPEHSGFAQLQKKLKYEGFDHVHWWVGNAKQAADWYVGRFGFSRVAYKGLETGSRNYASHVIRQGGIFFVFSSPLNPDSTPELGQDMGAHIATHGDGVKDVAFAVDDAAGMFAEAVARGAAPVREPVTETDEFGSVVIATVKTYGDTVHSFVQRNGYKGAFLPGYRAVSVPDPFTTITPPVGLEIVDHVVGNMPEAGMIPTVEWYEKVLKYHRFWSVDDSQIHTEYSALRSVVMADPSERIKMPINEPASGGKRAKSQIQEYVEYYGGSGVQHIALKTSDIITAIGYLRARGVDFLSAPATYYDALRARLATSPVSVKEDVGKLQELNILVDFDDRGYLLQLFTKPLMDRPTVFIEIIQREGNSGFGAGNFKSLFESIEAEQALRGNLTA